MEPTSQTFPTLRRWRGMSESEQDALLDQIEQRRRWRVMRLGALVALGCALVAAGIALYAA
jgi:hypothetical protein